MGFGVLSTVAITAAILYLAVKDWQSYYDLQTPHLAFRGIIVSLGLFGTFFGIFFGLLDFDTDDIEKGVPRLLEGLKIAFFTSLVGILCSIVLGIKQKLHPSSRIDSKTVKDYLKELVDLHGDKSKELGKCIEELGNKIVEAQKASTEEIVERIRAVGNDILDKQEEFNIALKGTVDTIHVRATDQIIDALNEIVTDFNGKLKEEFGKNFARLDDACENLVAWQESHIKDLESAITELRTLGSASKSTRDALGQIRDEIRQLLSTVKEVNTWHKLHEEAVTSMHKQLAEASEGKVIYKDLDKLAQSIISTNTDLHNTVKEQSQALAHSTSQLKKLLDELTCCCQRIT